MCQGGFLSKSATDAWEFLEDLAEKTMQWETTWDDSLSSRIARGGLHFVSDVSHLESKVAALENMLKGLTPQMTQLSQTATASCSHCQALDHSLSACPYFAHQLATGQEQGSMAFQRARTTLSLLFTIQGGEITLTSLGVMDPMLRFLTPNPSLTFLAPFRDPFFWVYLIHLDLHLL